MLLFSVDASCYAPGEPARGVHWHDNLAGDAPKVVEIAADDIADAEHQE